jgi:hypothetical protein
MHTVTSFEGAALRQGELSGIMADYLGVERARIIRRLLVIRCGLLALAAGIVGFGLHWLTQWASWISMGVLLTPPASAWIVELRRDLRLERRVGNVPGRITQVVSPKSG